MRRSPLAGATLASLVAGLALMIPFEGALTRSLGVAALFAFIACGVLLIAGPRGLAAPEGEEERGGDRPR